MRFGAHMSIAGGVDKAFDRAEKAGCDSLQIFTKNSNQWNAKPFDEAVLEAWKQREAETKIGPVVAHDSYLINLASPKDDLWEKSIDAFGIELQRCDQLGIRYLVTHPGSHTGSGEEAGLARVSEALNRLHNDMPELDVITLLETTAGQGTNLGSSFEHLATITSGVEDKLRVGYCLDTCHIFAAGYDFRTPEQYAETMKQFDDLLGIDRLFAIHLNDSKNDLGSRKDRHEHIGQGFIGLDGFRQFVNDKRLANVPGLLETKKSEDLSEDIENLATLRGLVD
ncbi:MAG: deoxyribonuclease IV [Sphaerobacteraceae bacterium]|nr:MAG: deoxyribonuclease IV [Sphaerobacteraceae bacterium]